MSLCYKAEVLRVRLHFLHHSKNFLFGWNIYHTNRSIPTNYYNLDVIISVGYRVNSIQATKFRIWATGILKEYMIKGFAMDDERLKQGKTAFGKDYFRELLERDRSIRASERRIWQQITSEKEEPLSVLPRFSRLFSIQREKCSWDTSSSSLK